MSETHKLAVRLKVSLLFTRRTYQLTVDVLLPFRLAWTATPDGFTVSLEVPHDNATNPLVVNIVPIACAFGGHRYLLRCPGCRQKRAALFWSDERLLCRTCAKLRYVSVTWSSDERLERHYRRRQRDLDTGLGRLSARAARCRIRAEIHAARWFGRCVRGLLALEARLKPREAKQRERPIPGVPHPPRTPRAPRRTPTPVEC